MTPKGTGNKTNLRVRKPLGQTRRVSVWGLIVSPGLRGRLARDAAKQMIIRVSVVDFQDSFSPFSGQLLCHRLLLLLGGALKAMFHRSICHQRASTCCIVFGANLAQSPSLVLLPPSGKQVW